MTDTAKPLRFGFAGWGNRGAGLTAELREAMGTKAVTAACYEPSDEAYNSSCDRVSAHPDRFTSVEEMLEKAELDGLLITSPNDCHLENLRTVSGRVLPVLIDKPLESDLEKIADVVRFAQDYPGPILVGHCMRFAPILTKAKELVDGGAIGRICSTRFVQNCYYGNIYYHNWRRERARCGSWMIEKATHDFDIMAWLIDASPQKVSAMHRLQAFGGDKPADLTCPECPEQTTCPESQLNVKARLGPEMTEFDRPGMDLCVYSSVVDNPDNYQCLIAWDNGVFGSYAQCFFSSPGYHHRVYELQGDAGAMEIDLGTTHGRITVSPRFAGFDSNETFEFDYHGRGHYNSDQPMLRHFSAVVANDDVAPEATVRQAFAAEALGYAALLAADEERFVTVSDVVPDDLKALIPGSYAE